MKKAILLFVLLLTMSFTFASNGLVEKSSILNDEQTIEVTQATMDEGMIMSQADMNALAPEGWYRCTYIGGGWWYCVPIQIA